MSADIEGCWSNFLRPLILVAIQQEVLTIGLVYIGDTPPEPYFCGTISKLILDYVTPRIICYQNFSFYIRIN